MPWYNVTCSADTVGLANPARSKAICSKKCHQCEYTFSRAGNLKIHIMMGDWPVANPASGAGRRGYLFSFPDYQWTKHTSSFYSFSQLENFKSRCSSGPFRFPQCVHQGWRKCCSAVALLRAEQGLCKQIRRAIESLSEPERAWESQMEPERAGQRARGSQGEPERARMSQREPDSEPERARESQREPD